MIFNELYDHALFANFIVQNKAHYKITIRLKCKIFLLFIYLSCLLHGESPSRLSYEGSVKDIPLTTGLAISSEATISRSS